MDDEIIKALMYCSGENFEDDCPKCPLHDDGNCNCNLAKYSLDLINRQKAEIERLKAELKEDSRVMKQALVLVDEIKKEIAVDIETAKAEAVKELIEKLTEEYKEYTLADSVSIDRIFLSIKHIARRMVGEG